MDRFGIYFDRNLKGLAEKNGYRSEGKITIVFCKRKKPSFDSHMPLSSCPVLLTRFSAFLCLCFLVTS